MLPDKVGWSLKEVAAVYVLRLVLGLLLVELVFSQLLTTASLFVDLADRLLMVGLVWVSVAKYKPDWRRLGVSFRQWPQRIAQGLIGGCLLLALGLYSERLYNAIFLLTPAQHPLIVQTQQAVVLSELFVPILLAGLAAPVAEEFLYRFFTFLPLKQRWGVAGGAIVSAAVFALMHFNVYWLGEIVVVGIGLALLYEWTGSLVSSIVAHSLMNTAKILMVFFNVSFI